MKTSDLKLGNWVSHYDNLQPFDTVSAIEFGMVHLSSKEYPDDERDLCGISITYSLLQKIGIVKAGKFLILNFNAQQIIEFDIFLKTPNILLKFQNIKVTYIHELQNILSFLLSEKECIHFSNRFRIACKLHKLNIIMREELNEVA